MKVERVFSIVCEDCGKIHHFEPSRTAFSLVESEPLGQSTECLYEWSSQVNCTCGTPIGFDYHVWEYPAGMYDTQEVAISGALVKRHFVFGFGNRKLRRAKSGTSESYQKLPRVA